VRGHRLRRRESSSDALLICDAASGNVQCRSHKRPDRLDSSSQPLNSDNALVDLDYGRAELEPCFMDEAPMNRRNGLHVLLVALALLPAAFSANGCAEQDPPYGTEVQLNFPTRHQEIWAVAPAVNLSGYRDVEPLLQADLLYQQLQHVRGLTVIPVNRVAEVYATLRIDRLQTPEQAAEICEILGCDRLIVPTVTAYDPYVPPKIGASLQVFGPVSREARRASSVDPHELARRAAPQENEPLEAQQAQPEGIVPFVQSVGMFDAANGSVRDALLIYASGRNDPAGPMGAKEYVASVDRYCGFVYHELIVQVMRKVDRAGLKVRRG